MPIDLASDENNNPDIELEEDGGDRDVKSIEKDLVDEKKRSEEHLNNWKRTQADFINYKRRQDELFTEIVDSANARLILDILPIYDTFSIAVSQVPKDIERSEWAKGILQIKLQLEDLLKKKGLEEIRSVGENFNADVHDAVEMKESEKPEGEILEEVQKGYKFNGKLIRAAKVKVAKKK